MTKVFCINNYGNPPHNSAARFGDIVNVTEGTINPFTIDRLVWSLGPPLLDFQQNDYLLLNGPGVGYILTLLILLDRYDRIKCLRFDSITRQHIEVEVSKDDIAAEWDREFLMDEQPITVDVPKGRIFVMNYSGHNITPAFKHSNVPSDQKLVVMTEGNIDQNNQRHMIECVAKYMSEFRQGDMLLLSGPPMLHVYAAVALHLKNRAFSILIYNPKHRSYARREIEPRHVVETVQTAKLMMEQKRNVA